jgi:predicted O-methyltransferase YrrM
MNHSQATHTVSKPRSLLWRKPQPVNLPAPDSTAPLPRSSIANIAHPANECKPFQKKSNLNRVNRFSDRKELTNNQMESQAKETLPPVLLSAFAQGFVLDAEGDQRPLHSHISETDAMVLYKAVRQTKPEVTAEVGFAQGISALAILKALDGNETGIHHVIDPFQDYYDDIGLLMVERAGLSSRMQFHRQFAEEVIPHLPPLDFALVDSSHLFDKTICEFVLLDRKLKTGGLLAFHDMRMPAMQKVLRFVLANRSYELVRTFDASDKSASRVRPWTSSRLLLRALHLLPHQERIFRAEVLQPWPTLRIPNLALLRKTAPDDRDSKFYRIF